MSTGQSAVSDALRLGSKGRYGSCNVTCASIMTCHGQPLQWVSEFRYLGVFIVSSRSFKCSLVHAKRSFYAAVNGLFGKLLNLASEEVILELVRAKCIPILLYGLECFHLGRA